MRIDTIIVGAGHAGLAVSRLLTAAGHDHVVLDRGRVAERWRSERWDSLHLLTPSWMTRLPGWCYSGPDPDG
jgi:putative flavoprotein involved in K+ transport